MKIGNKFGKLTVIEKTDKRRARNILWLCRCECGGVKLAESYDLKNGRTLSCGCVKNDISHGHTSRSKRTPTYNTWNSMIQRCCNPNANGYENYGGRGITVCNEWRKSFKVFLEDMGKRPLHKTIDRIDNDGNYEISNCRWATNKQQQNNKRRSK